jgi:hypothetical protein
MADTTATIWNCFSGLRDPRASRREKKHRLLDIVAIALCAVTAGAGDWPEVVAFAQARQDWLKTFLALPHGVPSRSTFERVFAALSPAGLQRCLLRWLCGCGRALGIGHGDADDRDAAGLVLANSRRHAADSLFSRGLVNEERS